MPRRPHADNCPAAVKPKCTCGADEYNEKRETEDRLQRLEKQVKELSEANER